ncbi:MULTISPECIES: chaplin [unclassified Streptomyces]|uniref:chaplin n=1 Tax=unclassified Streptomyces TaxID=2593676 RepID=UPI0034036E40
MNSAKKAALVLASAGFIAAGVAGTALADSTAEAAAVGSPGVASGNVVQIPLHFPINVCGNAFGGAGLLNPVFGNTCVNA